ncbi:MAG: PhzF family phenazine biosynthesis protein [Solirubrobacteraceae bacterium]
MISRPYVIVDVFAEAPLQGNPLAVFPQGSGLDDELMQRTALELRLSETVFLLPDEEADARARIFTPTAELPFAGHPVLGAALVLADRQSRAIRLRTGAGIVPVTVEQLADGKAAGELEHAVPSAEPFARAAELLSALGVSASELPIEAYSNGPQHVYVALASEQEVSRLEPDITALARLGDTVCANCFTVTGTQVKTRMFAPGLGVAEDPATGSAAGPLVVHLTRHGLVEPGRQIEIRQGEEIGRPSVLRARLEGETVFVGGAGFLVAHGEYRLG